MDATQESTKTHIQAYRTSFSLCSFLLLKFPGFKIQGSMIQDPGLQDPGIKVPGGTHLLQDLMIPSDYQNSVAILA